MKRLTRSRHDRELFVVIVNLKTSVRESNRLSWMFTRVSVSRRFGHAKTVKTDAYETK